MATYEGKWRCVQCRSVNPGHVMNCEGCGRRRPDDVQFFLEGAETEVTDAALLSRADVGPDWACPFCKGLNPSDAQSCQSCGAARTEGKSLQEETGSGDDFREKESYPGSKLGVSVGNPAGSPKASLLSKRVTGCIAAVGILVVGIVVAFAALVFILSREHDVRLVVDHVEWARSVAIEEYEQQTHEDWEDSLPTDAKRVSSRSDIHHNDRIKVGSHTDTESYTEQVSDGTETYKCGTRDKKNGFFEDVYCTRDKYKSVTKTRPKTVDDYKSVPVYRNKITYTIWRWSEKSQASAKGDDLNPTWPSPQLGSKQREGKRSETYHIYLRDETDSSKRYDKDVSAADFPLFPPGAVCPAGVNRLGKLTRLSPPSTKGGSY